MAMTAKKLYQGTLDNSAATLYTAPAGTSTIIKEITLCNTSGSAATFTLHFLPVGASVVDGNKFYSAVSLAAGTTVTYRLSQVLETGEKISGFSSATSSINGLVSGVEVVQI